MSNFAELRSLIYRVTPPIVLDALRIVRARFQSMPETTIEWEYIPEGWSYIESHPEVRGWNVVDVLETYKAKWPNFIKMVEGHGPLGIAHESNLTSKEEINSHNTIMVFAYALALASRKKQSVSMLDWGGGIGHYFLLAKAVLPSVSVDYHCKDVEILARHGQSLFPEQHFYSTDDCLQRQYDFVLSSGSLHFSQDWEDVFYGLAKATEKYFLLTRLPIVQKAESFVFVQRPYAYGYGTEYLAWCLNRSDIINLAENANLDLVREFIIGERPNIVNAPEQCQYRGFLFQARS
jgi:putative methyltransferase (TIGR04325 family)